MRDEELAFGFEKGCGGVGERRERVGEKEKRRVGVVVPGGAVPLGGLHGRI